MTERFDIIGGIVYLDKDLYNTSRSKDNDLSKLIGSTNVNMFRTRPRISTGIESVTIDYEFSDTLTISQDPMMYVEGLRKHYNKRVRGHLIVDIGDHHPVDLVINNY